MSYGSPHTKFDNFVTCFYQNIIQKDDILRTNCIKFDKDIKFLEKITQNAIGVELERASNTAA